jgi:ABC-2 type transport system permease protein
VITALARRELLAVFGTPLGWFALAVAQWALAWLLFLQLEAYEEMQPRLTAAGSTLGVTDLVITPTLNTASVLVMLIGPLFGLQGFAAERRSGRMALLLGAPVAPAAIVAGKFLGQWLALLTIPALALAMAATLGLAVPLDTGRLAAAALGLAGVAAMTAALGLWLSGYGRQPAAAAAATYGVLLVLWLLDSAGAEAAWQPLALAPRLARTLQGLVHAADMAYFVGLVLAGLTLATYRLWRAGGGR